MRRVFQVLGGPDAPFARAAHIIVVLALSTHGNRGETMRPSIRTLELQTNLGRTMVKKALRELEEAGLIRAVVRVPRQPVTYALGDFLRASPGDLRRALDAKADVLDARDRNDNGPDLREARAIIAANRHIRAEWQELDIENREVKLFMPMDALGRAQQAVAGTAPWPRQWPTHPKPDSTRAMPAKATDTPPVAAGQAPPRYASFAKNQTREEEPNAA